MKSIWDLIIIIFSIYNSILIPFEFAYTMESHIVLQICDRLIDVIFIVDIFINFRTMYRNSHTDELVRDSKKIAINYVLYGRFGVDLVASLPLEVITAIIPSDTSNLQFLGMLKMVRLLRLGRLITILRANQKLKFSMKLGQLIFFILMIMHWINCGWYLIAENNETWFPPKDLDSKVTIAYTGEKYRRYFLFNYYSAIILLGSEILPTNNTELLIATLLVFLCTIFIGIVIGEFASLLSAMSKTDRVKNEEIDIISSIMASLRLPEEIQDRVFEYHDGINDSQYVPNEHTKLMKYFQTRAGLKKISFLNPKNPLEFESFCENLEVCYFLSGDIILKQGLLNNYVYFVIEGLVEVFLEHNDFEYFDHEKVQKFISHEKKVEIEQKEDIGIIEEQKHIQTEKNLTDAFFEALRKAKQSPQNERESDDEEEQNDEVIETHNDLLTSPQLRCYKDSQNMTIKENFNSEESCNSVRSIENLRLSKTTLNQKINKVVPLKSPRVPDLNLQGSKNELHQGSSPIIVPSIQTRNKLFPTEEQEKEERARVSIINKFSRIDEAKNYTSLNELKAGAYFGEISCLYSIPITASICSISSTICARMKKEDFVQFLNTHMKCKIKIKKNLAYRDPYFKTLHKIVSYIPSLKAIPEATIQTICFRLSRVRMMEKKRIIRYLEICRNTYFVFSGEVKVNVITQDNFERIPFLVLKAGSCFNFYNSILGYTCLFEFIAETHCSLLCLKSEDLEELSKSDITLREVITNVKTNYIVKSTKYDFCLPTFKPVGTSSPNTPLIRSSRNINLAQSNQARGRAPRNIRLSDLNFLGSKLSNIPLKTLKKMKECRRLLIQKLNEAKKTFKIIDEIYESMIVANAKKVNSEYNNKVAMDNIQEAKRNLNFFENMHLMKKLDDHHSDEDQDSFNLPNIYEKPDCSFGPTDTCWVKQTNGDFRNDQDEEDISNIPSKAPPSKPSFNKISTGPSQQSNLRFPPSHKSCDLLKKCSKVSSKVHFKTSENTHKSKDCSNEGTILSEIDQMDCNPKNSYSTDYVKLEQHLLSLNSFISESIKKSSSKVQEIIQKTSKFSKTLCKQLENLKINCSKSSSQNPTTSRVEESKISSNSQEGVIKDATTSMQMSKEGISNNPSKPKIERNLNIDECVTSLPKQDQTILQ
ncbi:unnamed protein product [Moneuplotes crassus]|uniref:Cyclic nucleotide-binding domain-containing protein n=1 Tax=Euplotes crassus TaxID=5936 RepID=A0AAD1UG53_EUPCR|nr:unnamed protein product [Moneuplotes crassus]